MIMCLCQLKQRPWMGFGSARLQALCGLVHRGERGLAKRPDREVLASRALREIGEALSIWSAAASGMGISPAGPRAASAQRFPGL
jgi:hypothetical protein